VFRPLIHHTFGPHVTLPYALRSLLLLLQPWQWRHGRHHEALRSKLEQSFGGRAFLFSSGREALLALLRSIGLRCGEEVILQAYTCVVVPNAIHAAGGVPVYADVDGDTLNLDLADVKRRITTRTRAVIAQHTFGIPANLNRLRSLCDERGILLIEDCAHALPDDGSSPLGRTGDFTLLSFGRDKAISGVSGGAILSRSAHVSSALQVTERHARPLPQSIIARYLCYPLIYRKARALHMIGLGTCALHLCKSLHLLLPIVTPEEKQGRMPPLLRQCPNACAALTLYTLGQLPKINAHRRELTLFYVRECSKQGWNILPGINEAHALQKFPLFFKKADLIRKSLKTQDIHLEDGWSGCVVCPRDSDAGALGFATGDDPKAESLCEEIISLPTHPTMSTKQARRLLTVLRETLGTLGIEN